MGTKVIENSKEEERFNNHFQGMNPTSVAVGGFPVSSASSRWTGFGKMDDIPLPQAGYRWAGPVAKKK